MITWAYKNFQSTNFELKPASKCCFTHRSYMWHTLIMPNYYSIKIVHNIINKKYAILISSDTVLQSTDNISQSVTENNFKGTLLICTLHLLAFVIF